MGHLFRVKVGPSKKQSGVGQKEGAEENPAQPLDLMGAYNLLKLKVKEAGVGDLVVIMKN